ncbi:Uncharacterized protein dnm_091630 [Desulfonema magnum]|uniref:Uncharacterized protein n=1 Tax=Desulfonema magnum TaxID=45655 RepID=A0A975BWK0_9BACT|nr:hypothetical protein [Desulfonema magnum]QTA93066.1 Uncharacterized protein dnm_091630 [Desulfonema magnum]
MEESIVNGNLQVSELFEFVKEHASELEAYEMEQSVFSYVMKIGLTAMQCYFAAKGTGDEGPELTSEDGDVLKRESGLRGKDYFSVFDKFKVPRTCYRCEGRPGVMPLDARANLPRNCYSYLLQEWMDILCIRNTFEESSVSLEKLMGIKVYSNRFESVSRETYMNYDQYYGQKEPPEKNDEGSINVIGSDGRRYRRVSYQKRGCQNKIPPWQRRKTPKKKRQWWVSVMELRPKKEIRRKLPEIWYTLKSRKKITKNPRSVRKISDEWQAWSVREAR